MRAFLAAHTEVYLGISEALLRQIRQGPFQPKRLPPRMRSDSPGHMAKPDNPFRWFGISPEAIRTVVMMNIRFLLAVCQV